MNYCSANFFFRVFLFFAALSLHLSMAAQKVGVGSIQFVPASMLDVKGNLTVGLSYSGTNAAPVNGLLVEGNVGIGTTNPYAANLHVNQSTTAGIGGSLFVTNMAAPAVGNSARFGLDIQAFNDNIPSVAIDGILTSINGATDMVISTYDGSGSTAMHYESMRITSSGNVGIGTSLPNATLDLAYPTSGLQTRAGNGTAAFTNNQLLLSWNGTTSYTHAIKTRHNSGAATDNAIDFYLWNYGTDAAGTVGTKHVMSLTGNGNVGIGSTYPAYTLDVAGNGSFSNDLYTQGNMGIGTTTAGQKLQVGKNGDGTSAVANAWNVFSDKRWKKDITPINNALAITLALEGVNYKWISSGKEDFGFIAQDVEKLLPLAVHTDSNGYKSVDYARITAVLVEAIKEQQATINKLAATVDQLNTLLSKTQPYLKLPFSDFSQSNLLNR